MEEPQSNPPEFDNTLREMSHHLRTPLTSIMGFAELLLEDENIVGQQRDYLQTISDEARRLSGMLNHYLSVLLVENEREEAVERREE